MAWTEEEYSAFLSDRGKAKQEAAMPKPSKYRNVKIVIDGETFDSKREANCWAQLKMRERAGEIQNLQRQVTFVLCCPDWTHMSSGPVEQCPTVAVYIADFVYEVHGEKLRHVVDAKGVRTQIYKLKKKWLELQSGIVIEEV